MKETCILVADDDPKIRRILTNLMEGEGARVVQAEDAQGVHALMASEKIDLITLDLQLGTDNGFDIARDIRKTDNVPIIMVTGKDDIFDRVIGLELGADDYISKPFHLREVLARIRTVLRRSSLLKETADPPANLPSKTCISFDGMTANFDRYSLTGRDGLPCELTSQDFKLLRVFLEHPQRVMSRDQLMDLVSDGRAESFDRAIDNQIARLRRKIERDPAQPQIIKTVRGAGYVLATDISTR